MEQSDGRGRRNGRPQTTLILGAACALSAALCLAIPLYVASQQTRSVLT